LKINQGKNLYIGLFQTDTSINPGNSGGPLLDIYGNVIGITTAIVDSTQGVAFALPITREFVDTTIKSIQEYEKIVRPLIGIAYVDSASGVLVKDVFADLPASNAGIQK